MIEGARAAGIGALQRHRPLMIPDPAEPARTDRVTGAVEKLRWDLVETPGLAARGRRRALAERCGAGVRTGTARTAAEDPA